MSGGCGFLLELEESRRLQSSAVVEDLLQLCAQVAAMHTQQECLEACGTLKHCPGYFWVSFAVCLEQHSCLRDEVAFVFENLMRDRRRKIVEIIMASMLFIRDAWSRSGDLRRYPFMETV